MRCPAACLPLLFLVQSVMVYAGDSLAGYTFTLDGKPFAPHICSLNGTPDRPQAGDVAHIPCRYVGSLPIVLDEPGAYVFKSTPDKEGRLLLVDRDGKERVIAVYLDSTYESKPGSGKDKKGEEIRVAINPLSQLKPEEIRALRGVYLGEWHADTAAKLQQVDPARVCVTLSLDFMEAHSKKKPVPMPALPAGLQYLHVNERSNQGIDDWSALDGFKDLKFFLFRSMTVRTFDLSLLKASPGIRYLRFSRQSFISPETLASFGDLAELHLAGCEGLTTLPFIRRMKSLKILGVERSDATSLKAAGGLASLVAIHANLAPIAELPEGAMPSLRNLEVLSTRLKDAQVAAFSKSNPSCQVNYRWDQSLRSTLRETTRLRVRTGGTCHTDPSREKTIFEEKGPAAIQAVLNGIEVVEERSGGECMCCGDPTFEFYKGDQLLGSVGFHHGKRLRWEDGWPGDAELTGKSAQFLCDWLAKHGSAGARMELEEGRRQEAALERRMNAYVALMPPAAMTALKAAQSEEEAIAAFEKNVAAPAARAALYLKMFGCSQDRWNLSAGMDEFLQKNLLPSVDRKQWEAAIRAAVMDPSGLEGSARWIFSEGKWGDFNPMLIDEMLPLLARQGLEHPREGNRRETITALSRIRSPTALALLRPLLTKDVAPRKLPAEAVDEPGGMVRFGPHDDPDVDTDGCSERAYAAWRLAWAGDQSSLEAIRALARKATGKDKALLDKAVERLAKKAK